MEPIDYILIRELPQSFKRNGRNYWFLHCSDLHKLKDFRDFLSDKTNNVLKQRIPNPKPDEMFNLFKGEINERKIKSSY